MSFMDLARARYSVRKFKAQPVEQEKLAQILEAGRVAPTAKNVQEQHVYVLQSAEALEKVRELTPCHYGAPVVLLVTYDKNKEFHHPEDTSFHTGVEDASIVATHMMLMATELGIGSCWVNMFLPAAQKAFHIPANEVPVLLMPLGYAADDAPVAAWHTQYKPMGDLVTYL